MPSLGQRRFPSSMLPAWIRTCMSLGPSTEVVRSTEHDRGLAQLQVDGCHAQRAQLGRPWPFAVHASCGAKHPRFRSPSWNDMLLWRLESVACSLAQSPAPSLADEDGRDSVSKHATHRARLAARKPVFRARAARLRGVSNSSSSSCTRSSKPAPRRTQGGAAVHDKQAASVQICASPVGRLQFCKH